MKIFFSYHLNDIRYHALEPQRGSNLGCIRCWDRSIFVKTAYYFNLSMKENTVEAFTFYLSGQYHTIFDVLQDWMGVILTDELNLHPRSGVERVSVDPRLGIRYRASSKLCPKQWYTSVEIGDIDFHVREDEFSDLLEDSPLLLKEIEKIRDRISQDRLRVKAELDKAGNTDEEKTNAVNQLLEKQELLFFSALDQLALLEVAYSHSISKDAVLVVGALHGGILATHFESMGWDKVLSVHGEDSNERRKDILRILCKYDKKDVSLDILNHEFVDIKDSSKKAIPSSIPVSPELEKLINDGILKCTEILTKNRG